MHSRRTMACKSGMCDLCLKVTPDLLLDQGPNAGTSSSEEEEEEALRQAIYSILRQGYAPASCAWLRVNCLFDVTVFISFLLFSQDCRE